MPTERKLHAAPGCNKIGAYLLTFILCTLIAPAASASSLDAVYDARLHAMCLTTPPWPPAAETIAKSNEPIPKRIIQVWFGGNRAKWDRHLSAWRSYALVYGYDYRLYTDQDVEEILKNASPQMRALFYELWKAGERRGLSDLARFLILNDHGGIYIDADMRVPRWAGQPVDFATFMPFRGLVVVADGAPVDWGAGGLHVLTGIMASCPGHATLRALLEQLPGNVHCCCQARQRNSVLLTGPAPLTVLLSGPVTVIPVLFWDPLGVPDPEWR